MRQDAQRRKQPLNLIKDSCLLVNEDAVKVLELSFFFFFNLGGNLLTDGGRLMIFFF